MIFVVTNLKRPQVDEERSGRISSNISINVITICKSAVFKMNFLGSSVYFFDLTYFRVLLSWIQL